MEEKIAALRAELEADLQSYLDNYEATHDYDEYHFDLDTIEHLSLIHISEPTRH